jgi:hypothetical protein
LRVKIKSAIQRSARRSGSFEPLGPKRLGKAEARNSVTIRGWLARASLKLLRR